MGRGRRRRRGEGQEEEEEERKEEDEEEKEEKGSSSTFRELRAIEEGLRAHGRTLRGKIVRWGVDNWAAGKIVKWGSMKRDCHSVALEIEKLCRKFEVQLETFWISRDSKQIEYCDACVCVCVCVCVCMYACVSVCVC